MCILCVTSLAALDIGEVHPPRGVRGPAHCILGRDGQLGYFQFLETMNNAARALHLPLGTHTDVFLSTPGVHVCYAPTDTTKQFSKVATPIPPPMNMVQRVHPPTSICCPAILGGKEVAFHCGFRLHGTDQRD